MPFRPRSSSWRKRRNRSGCGTRWVRGSTPSPTGSLPAHVRRRSVGDATRARHGELAAGRLAVYQDEDQRDLEAVVHEEIDRLPEHFRTPLVLCDLEGCSHEQAARQLGWPVGTVKSRQARGRQRLRDRLIRRGLCPVTRHGAWGRPHARDAVPPALMKSTANLATICAGADSAHVAVLAREALTVMFLQSLKLKVLSLSVIALLAAGAGTLVWRATVAMPKEAQAAPATSGEAAGGRRETRAAWQDLHHGTTGTTRRPGPQP